MPQCRPLVFSQATFLHILNEFPAKHQPLWSRGCFDPQPQWRILHSWMLCYDLMPVQTSFPSLVTYVEVSEDLPKLLATSATSRHVFGFFTVASSNRLPGVIENSWPSHSNARDLSQAMKRSSRPWVVPRKAKRFL